MAERIDDTGFGGLRLIQDPDEFCYGVDAVMLADFAAKHCAGMNYAERKNVTAIDLGTGTGIIPFILAYKTKWENIAGIEVQRDSFGRALRALEMNSEACGEIMLRADGERRISFVNANVRDITAETGKTGCASLPLGSADVVTANPPYTSHDGGLTASNRAKAIARQEIEGTLEDFIACASALLRSRGEFFMIHRPSRLADICVLGRKYSLEPKEVQLICPRAGSAANIMIVHMVKDGGAQLTVPAAVNVYGEDGEYTKEVRACYGK